MTVTEKYPLRTTETKFSAQRRSICPKGTESRDKRQRQEIKDEGDRGGNEVQGQE